MDPYKEIRKINDKINELYELKKDFELEYLDDPKYQDTIFDDKYLNHYFDLFCKNLDLTNRSFNDVVNTMLSNKFTDRYRKEFA